MRRGSVAGLASASYAPVIAGLLTGPLLARALGPAGRGEIAAATVIATIVTTMAGLGVPLALAHAVAHREHSRASLLATSLHLAAWETLPIVAIAIALGFGPFASFSPSGRVWAVVLTAFAPIGVLVICVTMLLIGEGELRPLVRIQVVPTLGLVALLLPMYIAGLLFVWSYLALMVGFALLSLVLGLQALGIRPSGSVSLRPLVRFGLQGYLGYLAGFATIRLDQAIVGPVLGARQLGFYAVAATIAQLPLAIGRAIGSRAFRSVAQAGTSERRDLIAHYIRTSIVVSALAGAAIVVASPILPFAYGRAFEPSLAPLYWLLPGSVMLCGSATAAAALSAAGHPGWTTTAELVGLVATLVGLPLVLPIYGIVGAAILSSVTYGAVMIVYAYFLRRLGVRGLTPALADVKFVRDKGVAVAANAGRTVPGVRRIRYLAAHRSVDP